MAPTALAQRSGILDTLRRAIVPDPIDPYDITPEFFDDLAVRQRQAIYDKGKFSGFGFDLGVRNREGAELTPKAKFVKLLRVVRIPPIMVQRADEATALVDLHRNVLVGLRQNGVLPLTVVGNDPHHHGLLYLVGVQAIAETRAMAAELASRSLEVTRDVLSAEYRQIGVRPLDEDEAHWLTHRLVAWDKVAVFRGIPQPRREAGTSLTLPLAGVMPESTVEEQIEAFCRGMANREYLMFFLANPLSEDAILRVWRRISKHLEMVESEVEKSRTYSAGVSLPFGFLGNFGGSQGSSHSDGLSQGVSASHSNTDTIGTSVGASHTVGQSVSQSETVSHGTSQSASLTDGSSVSATHGDTQSLSTSQSHSAGTSSSENYGTNASASEGTNQSSGDSASVSTSTGHSTTDGTSNSMNVGDSNSQGTSQGWNTGSSASYGTSEGTNSSTNHSTSNTTGNTEGGGASFSPGDVFSFGGTYSHSNTSGSTDGTSHGTTDGTSQSFGASDGLSGGTNASSSQNSGESWGTTDSVGTTNTYGATQGTSNTVGSSQGDSQGVSDGVTAGVSSGASQGVTSGASLSNGNSEGATASTGTSVGVSDTTSAGASQSASVSDGTSTSQSASQSAGSTTGTSAGASTSSGSSLASTYGWGGSMGVSPVLSVAYGIKIFDEEARNLANILATQRSRFTLARQEGAWQTYTYLLAPDEATKEAGVATATAAFWGPANKGDLPTKFHALVDIEPAEERHLLTHIQTLSSCVVTEPCDMVPEAYHYSSVLTTSELSVLTHPPRIDLPGLQCMMEPIPAFRIPTGADGELRLGRIVNSESNSVSHYRFGFDSAAPSHVLIAGTTRSGKTVSAEQMMVHWVNQEPKRVFSVDPDGMRSETMLPYGAVILDWKKTWRGIYHHVDPARFRFVSLWDPAMGFKYNLLRVPRVVPVGLHMNRFAETLALAFSLGLRGKGILREALQALYSRPMPLSWLRPGAPADATATVFEEPDMSRFVGMADLYQQVEKMLAEAMANPKTGMSRRDGVEVVRGRLQYFAPDEDMAKIFTRDVTEAELAGDADLRKRFDAGEFSLEGCTTLEELVADQQVTVMEGGPLDPVAKKAVVTVLATALFTHAQCKGDGAFDPPLAVVLEEAHEVLVGGESSDAEISGAAETIWEIMWNEGASYGLRLWAICQMPDRLPMSVMANSGTVICHRIDTEKAQTGMMVKLGKDWKTDHRATRRFMGNLPTGWSIVRRPPSRNYLDADLVLVETDMLLHETPDDETLRRHADALVEPLVV